MGPESAARKQTWHVYLLKCADGTLYCGVTTDPARRLAQHNGQLSGGAKYTRPRRPVCMVACRECAGGRSEAQRLEERLRRLPRARKIVTLLDAELTALLLENVDR